MHQSFMLYNCMVYPIEKNLFLCEHIVQELVNITLYIQQIVVRKLTEKHSRHNLFPYAFCIYRIPSGVLTTKQTIN